MSAVEEPNTAMLLYCSHSLYEAWTEEFESVVGPKLLG